MQKDPLWRGEGMLIVRSDATSWFLERWVLDRIDNAIIWNPAVSRCARINLAYEVQRRHHLCISGRFMESKRERYCHYHSWSRVPDLSKVSPVYRLKRWLRTKSRPIPSIFIRRPATLKPDGSMKSHIFPITRRVVYAKHPTPHTQ